MSRLIAYVVVILLSNPLSARAGDDLHRLRALDTRSARLLQRGRDASPTFARLIDALHGSDLIVHVEDRPVLVGGAAGGTRFVVRAGGYRYVRIAIGPTASEDVAVGLLGHELYHALEIAQAAWVTTAHDVETLYRIIGHTHYDAGVTTADSPAARVAGRIVHAELLAFAAGD